MAVLDLIPAGANCLCEAQLQAACVWFCPLIWDAIEYLGLEFTKEVKTLSRLLLGSPVLREGN